MNLAAYRRHDPEPFATDSSRVESVPAVFCIFRFEKNLVLGPLPCSREAIHERMKQSGAGGRIINIGSLSATSVLVPTVRPTRLLNLHSWA
jgi:NAD(P)-dependent dehydrogenase (short-subunit alcohol dehydrogenase family)